MSLSEFPVSTTDDGRRTTDGDELRITNYETWSAAGRSWSKSAIWMWAALAGIMLLGLAIRLYGLTSYGIWWDEAYHVQLVRLPSVGAMLDAVLSNPPSDPLYVFVLRVWAGLFGTGDAELRMLSVLFSTLTLPATYWLGRVLAGPVVGLLGALLMAVSPYAVELGQEGALYALAALTITLALAAGWRWRSEGRGGLLYVLLGIVAIYSHYVAAAIFGLFAVVACLPDAGRSKVSGRAWWSAHAAIFGAWLPWLVALGVYWVNSPLPRATREQRSTASDVLGALVQYSSGSSALLTSRQLLEAAGLIAGAGLLVAGWLAGRQEQKRGLRVMLVIAAVIFLVPAIVSAVSGLWLFVPHFMVFLLPAMLCVLGAGAAWGLQTKDKQLRITNNDLRSIVHRLQSVIRPVVGGLLVVWIGVQLWGLKLYYQYPPHGADGLREMAGVLRSESMTGDIVLIMPPILTPPVLQYFEGPIHGLPADFDLRQVYVPFGDADWNARARSALEANIWGYSRFWLIYYPADDFNGEFLRGVTVSYKQLEHHHYSFADLYLLRNEK
jgi:4-amino-4-deoxy-L-arabinose transferase-like glycosyltransferase